MNDKQKQTSENLTWHPIKGVRLGTASVGIKQTERPDLVVIELSSQSKCSAVFTRNAFCAAPITVAKTNLNQIKPRYLVVNTGNANAGTGEQGLEDALAITNRLAELTQSKPEEVLPFSTGVIGELLPVPKILPKLEAALEDLSENNWPLAARGILTTDTKIKGMSTQFQWEGKTISITGIAKGSGMIRPDMATMLAYIATDAPISEPLLRQLMYHGVNASFNRITVDGDTSTNDACVLISTGEVDLPEIDNPGEAIYQRFKQELKKVYRSLAQQIVQDGEGATKFVSIEIEEATNSQEALDVAYTIAHSPLVKTALFASDANWGRILAAVGRSGIQALDLSSVQIFLDDVQIVKDGGRCQSYHEELGAKVMKQDEIVIKVQLGRGDAKETVWTTDLSHEYIKINAEYRT